jgi:hypothetical protein
MANPLRRSKRRLGVQVMNCLTFLLARVLIARPVSPVAIAGMSLYDPPDCSSGNQMFSDVPYGDPKCEFVQQFAIDEIASACGPDPDGGGALLPPFCPNDPVTRGQLAAYLERAMRGTATWEPNDVPNVQRSISIPLTSFVDCSTASGALLDFSSGADNAPDFVNSPESGGGFTITYDHDANPDHDFRICAQLMVPADYASGGTFQVRTTKDGDNGYFEEYLYCAANVNNSGLGYYAYTDFVYESSSTLLWCTPGMALTAGSSLSFYLAVSGGAGCCAIGTDDNVSIHSVAFVYTATQ